jgi:hypothetical protein
MADSSDTTPDKKRQQAPPLEFLKPGEEQPAPAPEQRPAAAWVTRPEDYQRPQYPPAPAPPRATAPGSANRPRAAGVLLIVAAATSVAALLISSFPPPTVAQYQNYTNDTSLYALSQVCNLFVIWAQAIMVLGGIMAFQRMNWRMTVSCAFFSMLMLGGFALAVLDPVMIGASFLGIVGFILTVISRQDFLS